MNKPMTLRRLGCRNFVKNIVQKKRSLGSRKCRSFVGKADSRGNDIGVPPGFRPHLVDCLTFENFCYDGSKTETRNIDDFYADDHYENSVQDCSPMTKHLVGSLEEGFKDANESIEAKMSSGRVCLSKTRGKKCSFAIRKKVSSSKKVTAAQHDVQFHSDNVAQVEAKETVEAKEREENDHEVVVLSKEQYLNIQKELVRLARQQEKMLWLMELREKRSEELRQLVISVLRNQQPPSSSP
ncbi:hypothetical protein QL285_012643 [Trifolium repens]|nr:hypothetical protein QL285_012643 [Trifolium repens]